MAINPHPPKNIGDWPSERSITQILTAPGPQTLQQLQRRGEAMHELAHELLRPPRWYWED